MSLTVKRGSAIQKGVSVEEGYLYSAPFFLNVYTWNYVPNISNIIFIES